MKRKPIRPSKKSKQAAEEYGTVIGPGEVRFERVLPGPIERVWAYLTDSEKRRQWFADGEMELRAGGRLELIFRNSELSHRKEPIPEKYQKYEGCKSTGQITRCEPPRLLTFLWYEEKAPPSEVMFELTPQGKEVLLVLTHRRLVTRGNMVGVSGGWHIHLTILADILNGVGPRPFWSTLTKFEMEYEKRIPADVQTAADNAKTQNT